MAEKTDAFENALLNGFFGSGTGALSGLTIPTLYVALSTASITDDNLGGFTEVSTGGGSNYARVALSTSYATVASGGTIKNDLNPINIPASGTAGTNWGTIKAVALYNASTGGTAFYAKNIADTTVNSGQVFRFNTNAFTINED